MISVCGIMDCNDLPVVRLYSTVEGMTLGILKEARKELFRSSVGGKENTICQNPFFSDKEKDPR